MYVLMIIKVQSSLNEFETTGYSRVIGCTLLNKKARDISYGSYWSFISLQVL